MNSQYRGTLKGLKLILTEPGDVELRIVSIRTADGSEFMRSGIAVWLFAMRFGNYNELKNKK